MPLTTENLVRAVVDTQPGQKRDQLICQAYSALAPRSPKKGISSSVKFEHIPLLHLVNEC